jgi:hypothetical protein
MKTVNITFKKWKIEAEHDGEKYHLSLESPCGKYYGSLAQAEDTGAIDNYGELGEKFVPTSVIEKAQELDDELYED